MVFGILFLIIFPILWFFLNLLPYSFPLYNINLSSCNPSYFSNIGDPARIQGNWFITYHGVCNSVSDKIPNLTCLNYQDTVAWSQIDIENDSAGYSSNFLQGANIWSNSFNLFLFGLVIILIVHFYNRKIYIHLFYHINSSDFLWSVYHLFTYHAKASLRQPLYDRSVSERHLLVLVVFDQCSIPASYRSALP